MNIEAMLLAKNRKAFDRVVTMIRSLIVKNTVAAEAAETTDTAEAYAAYESAYEGNDSAVSYSLTQKELTDVGFTVSEAVRFCEDPALLQTLVMRKDTRALLFIASKRKARVESYTENNTYYRPFVGLPASIDEYILVANTDKSLPTDPDTIYLHEVDYSKYPKTYNRLYYERDVAVIYETYDYEYLKFLENRLTPYAIRNKRQFDICYYDSTALKASTELPVFFDAYNTAKEEILTIDYLESMEETYAAYVGIMLMLLLYYTFNLYCVKTLERYAVRDYTEEEMGDILDSYGRSNLKSVKPTLLKNIVMNLPDLEASKGTQNIIDVIFDVIADSTLSVKRYYLTKKFNTDANGDARLSANNNGTYDDSVDLVFVEKTVKRGSNATFTTDSEYSYSSVTIEDDTWGGTQEIPDDDAKKAVKDEIRRELLSRDFSSIMTKYISLSKIIDMYAKSIEINQKLGVFYQINEDRGNFLKTDTLIYESIETTALSTYAAWCLVYAKLNGITNYDYIVTAASTIEGIMKLRKVERLSEDVLSAKNVSIDLGNGFSRTLGDYLTDEEIQSHLVSFKYNAATTIQDIIKQYEANYDIITAIEEKLKKQQNVDEYNVWNTIYKANVINKTITNLFSGYTSYSAYIKSKDPEFWKYIEPFIVDKTIGTKTRLIAVADSLKNAYAAYVTDVTNSTVQVIATEGDIVGGEDLTDISTIFNEYMSCYTQLFKQDFHIGYDNEKDNSLWLLYTKMMEVFITKDSSMLDLAQVMLKDTHYSKATAATLELLYYSTDTTTSEYSIELVLALEQVYELLKLSRRDFIDLDYSVYRDTKISTSSSSLGFVDTIRITPEHI